MGEAAFLLCCGVWDHTHALGLGVRLSTHFDAGWSMLGAPTCGTLPGFKTELLCVCFMIFWFISTGPNPHAPLPQNFAAHTVPVARWCMVFVVVALASQSSMRGPGMINHVHPAGFWDLTEFELFTLWTIVVVTIAWVNIRSIQCSYMIYELHWSLLAAPCHCLFCNAAGCAANLLQENVCNEDSQSFLTTGSVCFLKLFHAACHQILETLAPRWWFYWYYWYHGWRTRKMWNKTSRC